MQKSDLRTAQEILGHASPIQTATYTKVAASTKLDALTASTDEEDYSV
jgi:site-specific recombinase XerD